MITTDNILKDFCMAWKTLDAGLIIKHLDDSFVYDSQWVFASLDCEGYKEYIQGKFETLKGHGIWIDASIVEDPYGGGQMLKLDQNGKTVYYRIKVKNGTAVKGDMCMF